MISTVKKIELLIVEDDYPTRSALKRLLAADEFSVFEAECFGRAVEVLNQRTFDLILLDLSLPDRNGLELVKRFCRDYKNRIIVLTGTASVQSAVEAMKTGVFDFLEKPVSPERLLTTLQKAFELTREFRNYQELRKEFSQSPTFEKLIYRSSSIEELISTAKKIACSEINVLIHGETGTGKELIAHSIHNFSRRREKPFISVNCAAIPEGLAEAELFGYKKGAFTGASSDYPGKFRLGHQGIIFLDEVAELPLTIQGKMLRTLDSGEITPLKGTRSVRVDVRIIAATNKDLEEAVDQKRFREDLFYRIAEVKIPVPPLRERRDDIVPLADHFLKIFNITNSRNIKGIRAAAVEILRQYSWPGNIRELRNTMNEISALISVDEIGVEHLPPRIIKQRPAGFLNRQDLQLAELERKHIIKVLKLTGYNFPETIKLLGISRATLYRKLQEYQIERPDKG